MDGSSDGQSGQDRIVVFARLGVGTIDGRQGLVERDNLLAAFEAL
ncbi:hypothetical protein QFZ34_001329 [Phyllobacterium ifriqiyense]|uniref:Uncharacterized protein n=1 Tax=Phyllobacterium ifriqiyense TaxID=314238 RepID=A0ABU0S5X4_9HYPH|nr:hypothetical protein [Phyllobacterium ifriqiyense]MDQ0996152.1 hypothetical protein [Phyllobacterium ifriqiyense]